MMDLAGIGASLLVAVIAGGATGLITWGGMRTDLKWLRRDVDLAHERITTVEDDVDELRERRTGRVASRTRPRAAARVRRGS